MLFRKKNKNTEKSLSETFSGNFENNSHAVKKTIFVTKKVIPPLSKLLDYGLVAVLTLLTSRYYFLYFNNSDK